MTRSEVRVRWVCSECGSDDLTRISQERFDVDRQTWVEESTDNAIYNCGECGDETEPEERPL